MKKCKKGGKCGKKACPVCRVFLTLLKILLAAKTKFSKKEEEVVEEEPKETAEEILADIRELLKKD